MESAKGTQAGKAVHEGLVTKFQARNTAEGELVMTPQRGHSTEEHLLERY